MTGKKVFAGFVMSYQEKSEDKVETKYKVVSIGSG